MKKNKMMRIASMLLIAVLLTTCAISGTFAKYTSNITADDTARVAKWDVKVGGVTANSTSKFTFSLFDTILDTKDGNNETDVAAANGDKVIAPGTQGSFVVTIKNDSEVAAEYTVDYEVENAENIPIQFKVGDGEWNNSIDAFDLLGNNKVAIGLDETKSITVYWRWIFDGDDSKDTSLGLKGTDTIKVAVEVVATQVD